MAIKKSAKGAKKAANGNGANLGFEQTLWLADKASRSARRCNGSWLS